MSEEVSAPVEGEEEAAVPPIDAPGEEEHQDVSEEVAAPVEPTVGDLAAKLEKMERRTQYLQRKLDNARPESKPEPPPEPVVPELPSRPNVDDFETNTEYEDALFDWRDNVQAAKTEASTRQQKQDALLGSFMERADAFKAEHEDFDEVVENPVFSPSMRIAVLHSDIGPELAYHLGLPENATEAARIRDLPPEAQLIEMGRLETKVTIAKNTKKAPTAPDPIRPLGIGGGAGTVDESKMSDDDWYKMEKARQLEKIKKKVEGG